MTKQYVAGFLAMVSLVGFIGIMILIIFKVVPTPNMDIFKIMAASLFSLCNISFGYYLGSSQGSKLKTELAAANQKE